MNNNQLNHNGMYLIVMLPGQGSRKYFPYEADIKKGEDYAIQKMTYRILIKLFESKFNWGVFFDRENNPVLAYNSDMQKVPVGHIPWLNTNK